MEFKETLTINVEINGDPVEDTIPSSMLLSTFLRENQNLTGVHRGCESVKCGACTVEIDGVVVKSCNVLAVQVDNKAITTIEGVGSRTELHPIQESFWKNNGMQCGFCTPGFVMTTRQLLNENDDMAQEEIAKEISGHICRCTGYTKIIESIEDAAATMEDK